jgi:hypothetical protein
MYTCYTVSHPVFNAPAVVDPIWRYQGLQKLVRLLSSVAVRIGRHVAHTAWITKAWQSNPVVDGFWRRCRNIRGRAKPPAGKIIYLGSVKYVDYATYFWPIHNMYYPYVHKRQGFDFEKEVRAVTIISQAAREAFAARKADFVINDKGIAIPVDVSTLIEAI